MNSLLEQESSTLVFVALGIGILGMAYGRIKTKETLKLQCIKRFNLVKTIYSN